MQWIRNLSPIARVLIGLALGVLTGLFFGESVGVLSLGGDAYIRLLQMTVLPYILVSLAVGDPDTLHARAAFFFSTNRLNVALSRARTKFVLVASRGAFQALPRDPASLKAASTFKRLFHMLPQVDVTQVYAG